MQHPFLVRRDGLATEGHHNVESVWGCTRDLKVLIGSLAV